MAPDPALRSCVPPAAQLRRVSAHVQLSFWLEASSLHPQFWAGWLALRWSYSACTSLHQLAELTQIDQSIVTVLAEGTQHPRLYGGPEIPQLAACPAGPAGKPPSVPLPLPSSYYPLDAEHSPPPIGPLLQWSSPAPYARQRRGTLRTPLRTRQLHDGDGRLHNDIVTT